MKDISLDALAIIIFNVKCEPGMIDHWRQIYDSVIPAYHLNKKHWNSIILDGTIPEKDIHHMINTSYNLTKKSK